MGRKKKGKVLVILQAEVNDNIISELKTAQDGDPILKQFINEYKIELEKKDKEVFEVFDYFLVCEDGVYIALHEDEFNKI